MRTKIVLFFLLLSTFEITLASEDKFLPFEELPQETIFFIKTYFPESKFKEIVQREKNGMYQTISKEGWIFTFGKKGNWIDIDCLETNVPSLLVPSPILNDIARKYGPTARVVKITILRRGDYMIKLSNYIRLRYDKDFGE